MVYVWVPAERPLTDWVPVEAVLLSPLPLTDTDVPFVLDQKIVDAPGAVALVGLALIDALTETTALTVNVAVWVIGPP
jgi:hypothetical protein